MYDRMYDCSYNHDGCMYYVRSYHICERGRVKRHANLSFCVIQASS